MLVIPRLHPSLNWKLDSMPGETFNSRSSLARMGCGRPHAQARSGFLQRLAGALSGFAARPFRSSGASRSPAILHLDETQLLAHIDGELSKSARQQVADHLQSCWSCRGQFRELCARVESYVINRERQLPDSSSDSSDRVAELRQRLAQLQKNLPPL